MTEIIKHEEIAFDKQYYHLVKAYLNNNKSLIYVRTKRGCVYFNADNAYSHNVLLSNNAIKITKNNPLQDKIKNDLSKIITEN
jgi:hypothetical protein